MINQLRLLVWQDCNRSCKGCCNKDWDLKSLDVCKDFSKYDTIMLTGGEPLLYPERLLNIIYIIRNYSKAKIYVYTADIKNMFALLRILSKIDGITLTLHEQSDVIHFTEFNKIIDNTNYNNKSLRLNIFKGINIKNISSKWKVKRDMEWIKDCPLPKNEEFMRWC